MAPHPLRTSPWLSEAFQLRPRERKIVEARHLSGTFFHGLAENDLSSMRMDSTLPLSEQSLRAKSVGMGGTQKPGGPKLAIAHQLDGFLMLPQVLKITRIVLLAGKNHCVIVSKMPLP